MVIGAVVVVLALACSAMEPTALNVANRRADSVHQLVPRESQDTGILAATIDDYFAGARVSGLAVSSVGRAVYESVEIPRPGELVVSSAAEDLLRESSEFRKRYPGAIVGRLPKRYVEGPRAVVLFVGTESSEIDGGGWLVSNPRRNPDLRAELPSTLVYGYLVVLLGFVLPLFSLAAILAALGSRRQADRAAAMHLLGVSPRRLRAIAVAEDLIWGAVASILGICAFVIGVPRLAHLLPFGSGVWASDLSVNLGLAAALVMGLFLVSACATFRNARLHSHVEAIPDKRSSGWAARLSAVLFGLGVLLCAGSQLPGLRPSVSSICILTSIPMCAIGLVGVLPLLVRIAARGVSKASLSAMWAGRVIETDPVAAARTGMGMTMLLMVSGLMLLFFPLLADLSSSSQAEAARILGGNTIAAIGSDTQKTRDQWPRVAERSLASAEMAWYSQPNGRGGVALVDCGAFSKLVGIPTHSCENGLLGAGADLRPGSAVLIGQAKRVIPMTAKSSQPASVIIEYFTGGTGAILPRKPDRPPADSMFYLAHPRTGGYEPLRTAMGAVTQSALTFEEQYEIATFSTRQFTRLLWFAIALTMAIASLSALISTYDRIGATRPERRLLAIGGAPRTFATRALHLQVLVPLLIAVPVSTAVSLGTSMGFVRLFEAEGGIASVPLLSLVVLAAVSLVVPAASTAILLRAESDSSLMRNPE